jgi:hypothetical protein
MVLVVAMLLRYFDFTPADPDYTLQVATTLTVKPKDFFMKAELRSKWTAVEVEKDMLGVHGSPRAELPHVLPSTFCIQAWITDLLCFNRMNNSK